MQLEPFHLERYFSRYEFSARYLLSSSDCESVAMAELVAGADEECRSLWDGLTLGYTESPGLPLLRHEIAALYEGLGADEVLEVVPEEGILLAMMVLLEPGDHVVTTWPGYQSLFGVAERLGCEVTYWQPEEDDDWRFDPHVLRAALRPTTRLVVVNFPHNPTGSLPSRGDFDEILGMVEDAGAHLFCDEMYRWLEQDAGERLPSAIERYGKAITLCGMSKTFSLPGLRVGWLATHDGELLRRIAAAKDYTTICAGAPGEILAVMGLRARDEIVAGNLRRIATNADRVEALAAARPGLFEWVRPRAGSIGLARLGVEEGALAFCQRLVAEAGVMLAPSTVFGYGDAHVRFGLGRATFPEGLDVLEEWLDRART